MGSKQSKKHKKELEQTDPSKASPPTQATLSAEPITSAPEVTLTPTPPISTSSQPHSVSSASISMHPQNSTSVMVTATSSSTLQQPSNLIRSDSNMENSISFASPIGGQNVAGFNGSTNLLNQSAPLKSEKLTNPIFVRALFTFEPQTPEDLEFKKGERLVLTRVPKGDWWFARHMETSKEGFIPSNYVVIDDGKMQSQDCWFDVSRRDADRLLLLPGNSRGCYLIRPSSDPRNFALSIRDLDPVQNVPVIKHYKLRTLDDGLGYYISAKLTFPTFGALIAHYEKTMDGLCCKLSVPCPRAFKPPVKFKDFEINRNALKMNQKLGSGSFGEVWRAKMSGTVDVAVKMLKKGGNMAVDDFLKEAKIMHKLSHPKIVQLLGVCTQEEPILIIIEYMVNGALLSYLRSDKYRPLITFPVMVDMLAQICDGMEYLEAQNYVHRDLRAANILTGENNIVKVADFGLAKFSLNDANEIQLDNNTKFPVKWTAPEALKNRLFSIKSDVWSFGVVIYEVVTLGRAPYPDKPSTKDVYNFVINGGRMEKPTGPDVHCPDRIYETMQQCWATKPEDRPTFSYLKDFFDNYTVQTENSYG